MCCFFSIADQPCVLLVVIVMPIHSAFLRYFDEVCKSGSIRKASAKLHIASSAVNRQILKVEDELDVRLFDRSHEGIQLTEAGRLLQQHISRTLSDADRTLREISACKNKTGSGIMLVGQESVISRFLPPVLMNLHAAFPDVSTSFMAASGRELRKLLLNGSADIALMFDARYEQGIEFVGQIRLPVGAVMAASHPLADRSQLSVQECTAYSLILPDESWPLRDKLDRVLAHADVNLGAATTSNSIEFFRAMLAEQDVIGSQTIIGLEEAIEQGSLVHIPLCDAHGDKLTQTFSIGVSENRHPSEIIDKTLLRLKERLIHYEA